MSDVINLGNKVNGSLDYRNIKKTQFDSAQTLKLSFSELQSSLRTFPTNAILRDGYTHFVQSLNEDDLPIHVVYWQANRPFISQLTLRADVNGDLRDTYILLEEYLTKRTIALYCVVDGTGTAPGVADLEVAVTFNENDSAAIVTYAFLNAINNNLDYFEATRVGSIGSSNKIDIKFLQFGESSPINVGTTGFTTATTQEGESFKVGEVFLDYDADNNPIFNGSVLRGAVYNPYTAEFVSPVQISDGENELAINDDGSINANIVTSANSTFINEYDEVNSVASEMSTTVVSYTVPAGGLTYLQQAKVSGENIAEYTIKLNGQTLDKVRTYFGGSLNESFNFSDDESRGLLLSAGDTITIDVIHSRPDTADFNGRIQLVKF